MSDEPIRWRKVQARWYRNTGTGVEIRHTVDQLNGWPHKEEGWFVYEPQPGPELTLWPMGFQLSLAEAKRYDGADLVASMRSALADESFRPRWSHWLVKIEEWQ